jgi:hypothetical protein
MKTDRRPVFEDLEPPPGGAHRFARRLDAASGVTGGSRQRRFALIAAATGVAAVLAAVVIGVRGPAELGRLPDTDTAGNPDRSDPVYDAPEFDRLLGRRARPVELRVARDERTASVAEIDTASDKIRIYQID